jgi:hypothetical protein
MTESNEWIKLPSVKLSDDGKTLLFDDENMAKESKEKFKAMLEMAVQNKLSEESQAMMELIESRLQEHVDDYLHYTSQTMCEKLQNQFQEDLENVADLIVKLADSLNPEQRAEFYRRAAQNAEQQPRPADNELRTLKNQDGAHGVPDGQAACNRASLRPDAGTGFGIQKLRESANDGDGTTPEVDLRIVKYMPNATNITNGSTNNNDLYHKVLMEAANQWQARLRDRGQA